MNTTVTPISGESEVCPDTRNLHLQSLVDLSLALNSTLNFASVLDIIRYTCLGNFSADYARIYVREDDDCYYYLNGEELKQGPEIHPGITAFFKMNGLKPANRIDFEQAGYDYFADFAPVAPSAVCPTFFQNELNGLIVLQKKNDNKLTASELVLLKQIANIAGTAIHNTKVFHKLSDWTGHLENTVKKRTRQLEEEKIITEKEREKSEELLQSILPKQIAQELKTSGSTKPKSFQSASVLFTDFVGFTSIAEALTPEELVDQLDKSFSFFDAMSERYGLEKLKTIGDAFMAAGGIPIETTTHAVDCTMAALEIREFMFQMKTLRKKLDKPFWELRLGIHSGPLVAGVIGEKKFAYDVWGDTVNTASRMESSGVVNHINVSETTYQDIKYFFTCEYRGLVPAKNKKPSAMYLVKRLRPLFAEDDKGLVPNDKFWRYYEKLKSGARFKLKSDG